MTSSSILAARLQRITAETDQAPLASMAADLRDSVSTP
jgi:hypothetical protein